MLRGSLSRTALACAGAWLLASAAACSANDAAPGATAGSSSAAAGGTGAASAALPAARGSASAAAASSSDAPSARAGERGAGERAPFELTLRGPGAAPESGELELVATLSSPAPLLLPTTIRVVTPKGARLVSGKDSEALESVPSGATQRTYKFQIDQKLADPIRVVVDARSADGSMGAHAERLFPEPAAAPKPTSTVPAPPVGRPGAPDLGTTAPPR